MFASAPFVAAVGYALEAVGEGWAESTLAVEPRHLQHDGFIHAGVQGTMADHTAGAAGGTMVGAGRTLLTVEYKLNLLRPAVGEWLRCRATVLKPGRSIFVVESEVTAGDGGGHKLVAKAIVTLAVVALETLAE
jgi:uncharacterized protein (TIGR00369 family)